MNEVNYHQTVCAVCGESYSLEELIGTCLQCRKYALRYNWNRIFYLIGVLVGIVAAMLAFHFSQ